MNGMLSIYYFIIVICIPVESFRGYKINCKLGFRTNCSSNESRLSDPKELLESDKINDKSENGICDDSEPDNTSPRFGIDKSIIYTLSHDEYVVVGKILGTYGLKGHVKVKSYTSQPEIRLCEPGYRYLKIPFNDEKVIPINLVASRFSGNKDVYIVKFEGFDNIQQSQRITNTYLTVPLSIMPPLEENTYYARDIIGLGLYLYNDINKTKLGNIISFIHHSDLAFKKKYEEVCDDLIEVQLDMKVSLKTLINVSKASINNGTQNSEEVKGEEVKCSLVMERDLEEADEIIEASKEFENPYFKSMMYIKYYECSVCKREFTNQTTALLHENIHNSNPPKQLVGDAEEKRREVMDKKMKIMSIEDIAEEDIKKPIRRFYVPLIRSETVKYIDVENKSVYVDPYTIFIGEDR